MEYSPDKPLADGRVYFTASKLFEVSLCLRGAQKGDGWFFVGVEFSINIGGGLTGLQGGLTQFTPEYIAALPADIPRVPTGIMAQHITNEADARLAYYLQLPEDPTYPSGAEVPPRPHLPEGVIDTPLVRLYNFLRMHPPSLNHIGNI
jgi:mediator of RNA polymerase II transcription subunit 14